MFLSQILRMPRQQPGVSIPFAGVFASVWKHIDPPAGGAYYRAVLSIGN
jgi:hypothetical protein